ncbi:MAG: ATP-grasp domain-containing protein [Bacilli bacterium]|nr:ATP-grasp domain-containing protein [Bacilli bacterium]
MLNFIFISPQYPERNYQWVEALAKKGIRVLGIGDSPYHELNSRVRNALTEYYTVYDMTNMGKMIEAVSYYQNKYGKIDYIESNNEWWLQTDAVLREWFGVTSGFYPADMEHIKAKSAMKASFEKGGAKTIRYLVVRGPEDKEKAKDFVKKVGFPVFVKPDIGVGASDSYSLRNEADFDAFFERHLPEPYIMEEEMHGSIVSFDGICNEQGDVVFCCTDHFPIPIAELVHAGADHCYWNVPFALKMDDIQQKEFEKVGRQVVKAFGIRKRFFHIEFFVLNEDRPGLAKKGEFVALECNMRAPGGYTPDLIDFGSSVSVFDIYADVIAYNENRQDMSLPKYYAMASHRRNTFNYLHDDGEIYAKYGEHMKMTGDYPANIAVVMGNRYYMATFETLAEAKEFDAFVRAKR